MLKNLKLGAKIGGGFALLIVLTIVVGLISVFNMLRVSANVEKLSDEYVPEVEIACRVERDAQNAVSEFRGYVFSEEDDYLEKGIENLDNLDKGIKLAKDLANQSIHLEKLKAEIEDIESLTIQYRRLSDETAKLTDMIGNEKITLNESAAVYMQNCQEFLDSQYLAMKNEINQGVTDSKLKERSRKIELSTEIYKIGFEARVDIWKALAHRNTEDFDDGIVKLNQADEIIKSLRKITHKTNNQNQLDNIKTARQNYEKALLNIHDHWEEREDLQKQSEAISKDLLLKTQHTAKAGIDQTTIIATEGSNLLSASTKILTIGLLVAIVAGVIIAIFITTSITKPIKVIATVSDAIAVGDLTKTVRFDRNDEIGQMARSFNRMSDSIRGKAEVAEAISQGKLSIDVEVASEEDVLGKALVNVRDNLNSIVSQMETLAKSAIDGHLHHRADANSFKGDYQQLVKGINKVIDTLVGHMDVVPAPLMLIDKEFNINYMNKYGADLCGQSTKEIVGSKCFDHFKTGHCNTKECACAQAMNTKTMIDAETSANPCGNRKEIRYSGVPTYDIDGNVNGALEIVSDQTDIVLAQRKALKISDYQAGEIEKLSRTLQSMSDGDLTVSYKMAEADDDTREVYNSFLGLSQALEETLQGLNEILGQVNVAVEQVNSGSSQVSSASQSLSQGATEQAASLEEVSSSMTEVGAQVQQNADNAEQANTLSATAGKAAEQGNRQMQDMLSAMEDINDSSSQIQKIIKVIDEIAFQTNLLALNAAVEAARAGVHGKGFAVVAEEVRNLAQRSAKAANETTELIEGSVANTENGSQIAQQTAIALEEIEQQVSKVSDLISEINAGSREQNTAIKEIAESLGQIDQVTQANTANAEESAAAAEELAGQSTQLKEMISRFKLVENGYSGITRKSMKRISSGNITGQYGNSASSEKAGAHPKMIEQVEPTEVISLDDTDFGDF